MELGEDISITLILLGISGAILLIPIYGINNTAEINVEDQDYTVELVDNYTLEDGDYWGSHNIVTGKIKLATGGKGVLPFLNTCSHEVRHLKFDLKDVNREDKLSTEEEHERMSGLGSNYLPWNWQPECIGLLPERFGV